MRINIKPLSVNQCYQGRRFKNNNYKKYELALKLLLKPLKLPKIPYCITYRFGFSSKLSDLDNPVKPLQDILCRKYGFDDRYIYKIIVEKEIVAKGEEYLDFKIESLSKEEEIAENQLNIYDLGA